MKTDDLIKYVLLGLGVYIVWQYVLVPMMNPTVTTPAALPPVSQTPNVLTPIYTPTPDAPVPVIFQGPVLTQPVGPVSQTFGGGAPGPGGALAQ